MVGWGKCIFAALAVFAILASPVLADQKAFVGNCPPPIFACAPVASYDGTLQRDEAETQCFASCQDTALCEGQCSSLNKCISQCNTYYLESSPSSGGPLRAAGLNSGNAPASGAASQGQLLELAAGVVALSGIIVVAARMSFSRK